MNIWTACSPYVGGFFFFWSVWLTVSKFIHHMPSRNNYKIIWIAGKTNGHFGMNSVYQILINPLPTFVTNSIPTYQTHNYFQRVLLAHAPHGHSIRPRRFQSMTSISGDIAWMCLFCHLKLQVLSIWHGKLGALVFLTSISKSLNSMFLFNFSVMTVVICLWN